MASVSSQGRQRHHSVPNRIDVLKPRQRPMPNANRPAPIVETKRNNITPLLAGQVNQAINSSSNKRGGTLPFTGRNQASSNSPSNDNRLLGSTATLTGQVQPSNSPSNRRGGTLPLTGQLDHASNASITNRHHSTPPLTAQGQGGNLLSNNRQPGITPPLVSQVQAGNSLSNRRGNAPPLTVQGQASSLSINRRGSKRRVSDATPNWHPRNKKRPRSEGDVSRKTRTLHFSPYTVPDHSVRKSPERSVEMLNQQIWDDFCHTRQSQFRYEQKLHLRDYLLSIFNTAYPGCSLHICGSTCNGLATNDSDMDLCLLLSQTRVIDQRFEARRILHQLNVLLRRSVYIQRCQVIHAKVPILKFRDIKSGCESDVNINNTVGIRNTHLLQGYCGYDWRVRPLIMVVKKWAKHHGINDASQGTLSSYSVVMMVLHYLQASCKPPVLPSLQAIYPEIFSSSRNVQELAIENPCMLFTPDVPDRSENQETLGALLLGFFRYYAEEFSWKDDVISVRQGAKYSRGDITTWFNKYICIEEPFDLSCVTRAVHTKEKFDEIKRRIRVAYYTLTVSPFLESILSGS